MKFLYLEEIDSTNKYAKKMVNDIEDMTVVYTYNQTAGRGRLNRKWSYAGKDNIYASIVLKPSERMEPVYSNLTQLLCLVLAQTFEEYGISPKIKWPNDIMVNKRKISGILAEAANDGYKLTGLILGFGVNLNTTKEFLSKIDQPATSLNIETGCEIDKEKFLKKVLDRFCLLYNSFIKEGFLLIREEYKKRAAFLSEEITVKVFDRSIVGKAVDIAENGALILADKQNEQHVLLIGDIL